MANLLIWWRQRTPSEQRLLLGLAGLLVVCALWYGLWQPWRAREAQWRQTLMKEQASLRWMTQQSPRLQQLSQQPTPTAKEALTALVMREAASHGLAVARLQPQGKRLADGAAAERGGRTSHRQLFTAARGAGRLAGATCADIADPCRTLSGNAAAQSAAGGVCRPSAAACTGDLAFGAICRTGSGVTGGDKQRAGPSRSGASGRGGATGQPGLLSPLVSDGEKGD